MNRERGDCSRHGFGRGSRFFLATFLIIVGTVLFLSNLGILPIRNIWTFWPTIIIAIGVLRILQGPDWLVRAVGGLIAGLGVLFLLVNLGVLQIRVHDRSWPISILLIALGSAMLLKLLDNREPRPMHWSGLRPLRMGTPAGFSDFSFLGSVKRRVDTADFRGGAALSVLGSLELDLRHARIADPSQPVQLEVSAVLGEAKIRMPETWRVRIHGASIMGNYEDKTVPGNLPIDAPTVVITGHAILASVEITD